MEQSPVMEDGASDEEVFFGRLTLKEIKKILCRPQDTGKRLEDSENEDNNRSIRLIHTQSQPNLRGDIAEYNSPLSSECSPLIKTSDESFIQMENIVEKLCRSPRTSHNVELNNTLEVIDYITHRGNQKDANHDLKKEDSPEINLKNEKDTEIMQLENDPKIKQLEDSENEDNNRSIRLIHTQSQPNLRGDIAEYNSPISSECSPLIKTSDESFILMENIVEKLCRSPRTSHNVELNNTLEVIDYITHRGNQKDANHDLKKEDSPEINLKNEKDTQIMQLENDPKPQTPSKIKFIDEEDSQTFEFDENLKTETTLKEIKPHIHVTDYIKPELREPSSPDYHTPAKVKTDVATPRFKTPTCCLHLPNQNSANKTPEFKTPSCQSVLKKPMTARNTPGRSNKYDHIASPIAGYIRNSPQVPLVKDVHPKKQLPAMSSIPKLVKHTEVKSHARDKENMNLPSAAFKSAKTTKITHLQDVNKLPQSQRAKKITSVPTVRKHESRKMDLKKRLLTSNLEDSMANMSVDQAEVSVCTLKTAFKPINKY